MLLAEDWIEGASGAESGITAVWTGDSVDRSVTTCGRCGAFVIGAIGRASLGGFGATHPASVVIPSTSAARSRSRSFLRAGFLFKIRIILPRGILAARAGQLKVPGGISTKSEHE
ncbi:MAG: hypothetical protein ACREQC_00205, partial [Candidatus Binataceae bacterium]